LIAYERLTAYALPDRTSAIEFTLKKDDTFTALDGELHVRDTVQLEITKAHELHDDMGRSEPAYLQPGQHLLVLADLGEAFYEVSYAGRAYRTTQFWARPCDASRPLEVAGVPLEDGDPTFDWWVRVEDLVSGRRGWVCWGCTAPSSSRALGVTVTETTPCQTPHSPVRAGESFTKTWRFHNTGPDTWRGYHLRVVPPGGADSLVHAQLTGPANVVALQDTASGGYAHVSVSIHAPQEPTCSVQSMRLQLEDASGKAVAGALLDVSVTVSPPKGPDLTSAPFNAPTNPFAARGHGGQCTAFVWGMAKDRKLEGILPTEAPANANTWLRWVKEQSKTAAFCEGDTCSPQPDSIAVWKGEGRNPDGHVAYIESVEGSRVRLREANMGACSLFDEWGGGSDGSPKERESATLRDRGTGVGSLAGYIYLRKQ